jgi:ubiquinone/menaquinone biosynthesis C-methylase UbiE
MEKMMMGELRASIWQKVQGEKILEVGVGTGKNFPRVVIVFSPVQNDCCISDNRRLRL